MTDRRNGTDRSRLPGGNFRRSQRSVVNLAHICTLSLCPTPNVVDPVAAPTRTGVAVRRFAAALTLSVILAGALLGCRDSSVSLSPSTFREPVEVSPDPVLSMGAESADWYRDAIVYHVWINAFNDSNGDGIGDIPGITERLDYLKELGVDTLWLSPFFESASTSINLHMYDTVNHYRVDPRFGTRDDVVELLAEAHERDMRLLFDWVPNHVSIEHQWFRENPDWFVWRDEPGSQSGPWGQTVWHQAPDGRWYYGVFWEGMPDINFRNQHAKDAITNTAIHWLNMGFDGMRIDAVKYLFEGDEEDGRGYQDHPDTYEYFAALRNTILAGFAEHTDSDGNPFHKVIIAENWTDNRTRLLSYLRQDDVALFHMTLDFPFATHAGGRDRTSIDRHWRWTTDTVHTGNGWMATFLSNHDDAALRPATMHGDVGSAAMRAMQIFGPGTPIIYYGNEIGMQDASQFGGGDHADRRHRQPFEWERAAEQEQYEDSLLNVHRRLTRLRHDRISLRRGDYTLVSNSSGVMVFTRRYEGETTLAVVGTNRLEVDLEIALPAGVSSGESLLSHASELQVADGVLRGSVEPFGFAAFNLIGD